MTFKEKWRYMMDRAVGMYGSPTLKGRLTRVTTYATLALTGALIHGELPSAAALEQVVEEMDAGDIGESLNNTYESAEDTVNETYETTREELPEDVREETPERLVGDEETYEDGGGSNEEYNGGESNDNRDPAKSENTQPIQRETEEPNEYTVDKDGSGERSDYNESGAAAANATPGEMNAAEATLTENGGRDDEAWWNDAAPYVATWLGGSAALTGGAILNEHMRHNREGTYDEDQL